MNEHTEKKLAMIRSIFEDASTVIDAIIPGERIGAAKLAESIGMKYGISGPTLYHTLKLLLDGYPNTVMRLGPKGGLEKLPETNVYLPDSYVEDDLDL
jgi:hypothetical protein